MRADEILCPETVRFWTTTKWAAGFKLGNKTWILKKATENTAEELREDYHRNWNKNGAENKGSKQAPFPKYVSTDSQERAYPMAHGSLTVCDGFM